MVAKLDWTMVQHLDRCRYVGHVNDKVKRSSEAKYFFVLEHVLLVCSLSFVLVAINEFRTNSTDAP